MRKVDHEALRRALRMVRTFGAADADQIDRMLQDRAKLDVAVFAAYSCQCETLGLMPYQPAPMDMARGPEPVDHFPDAGRRAAWTVAQRLVAAGLSIYEPDPPTALREAEARARGDLPPPAA
jgi:hypothetical protein